MRRFVLSLLLAGVVALGIGPAAVAAPSEVSATFGPKAQYVSPTTILVPVTVTCPATFVTAFIQVLVSQSDTGGSGFSFTDVPCTDNPETSVVVVTGGPFTLGQAVLSGFAQAAFEFDSDTRRIQIDL